MEQIDRDMTIERQNALTELWKYPVFRLFLELE